MIIVAAGEPVLGGQVGLAGRGNHVVELAYGIAPDRRGRGYATSAARLAARWLLDERHASVVGLRIGAGNTASQRAALGAGFTRPGPSGPACRGTGGSLR